MTAGANLGRGRAASYLSRINLEIVKAAARRRQRADQGHGARLPAALAGAPVTLVEVQGPAGPMTPPAHKTARRVSLSPILAKLSPDDPRRKAAEVLAGAVERVDALRGVDWGGSDSSGEISDGGATTRVKHSARLRLVAALVNRWPVDRRHGPGRGLPRAFMRPRRRSGNRLDIMALPVVLAVCVDGQSLDQVLRSHGWSAQAANRNPLRDALLECLDDVAEGLGLGRVGPKKSVDLS